MSHPTRIARIILAALTAGAVGLALPPQPAGAWPILKGSLQVTPNSGRAGSMVLLRASKFLPNEDVSVSFWDGSGSVIVGGATTNGMGRFELMACVPWNAAPGADTFVADSIDKRVEASATFYIAAPQKASDYPRPTLRKSAQTTAHVPRDTSGLQRTATDYPQPTSGGGAWSPDSICV